MKFREIPEGKGQTVYIDKDWLNGKDEQSMLFFIPDDAETPAKKLRREMVEYLYECGYSVITDSKDADEDTFFFSQCFDEHINSTIAEYIKKKEKKISECFTKGNVTPPLTFSFPVESFPEEIPSLPFVLKNESENGGKEKFLIKTPEQLAILRKFYEEARLYDRRQKEERIKRQYSSIIDINDWVFDENGKSNQGITVGLIDYKKRFHEDFVLQEYIKTPTKYNTSLRVITSSSGDILCSSLKYSESDNNEVDNYTGLFDRYLSNPNSPYFLGSESIISNTVAGGNSILLGKNNYSQEEQAILLAHGVDPSNASVPADIVDIATRIALHCRREIGSISGMDFIYDDDKKVWKFLEQHEYPMLYTYAESYGFPYNTEPEHFFETNRVVDIDSRLNALSLSMQKKQSLKAESENIGKHI